MALPCAASKLPTEDFVCCAAATCERGSLGSTCAASIASNAVFTAGAASFAVTKLAFTSAGASTCWVVSTTAVSKATGSLVT